MTGFQTVATIDDIPEGEGRCFELEDQVVAIFNIDGSFSAINDMCPHMGASLSSGHLNKESCVVSCPWHGWRFNVVDGTWADNPRIKTDVFEVRVVDGRIQVRLENPQDKKTDTSNDGASCVPQERTDD